MKIKSCAIIGDDSVEITKEFTNKTIEVVEYLVKVHEVSKFMMGFSTDFDNCFLEVLTFLKPKYGWIDRICCYK